ncbi:cyclophilin-like fold protein [Proteocatella sphenisci]|uniref:cyclophilin-like fold protein n=1 Tax=Proteocatella sphenisci TaxID=181070 RepID=UPI0004AE854B|nr:cyclophilin-like fold protein [Proteocatella sphenisci]
MKKIICIFFPFILVISLLGCSSNSSSNSPISQPNEDVIETPTISKESDKQDEDTQAESNDMPNLSIQVGNIDFKAILYDNVSTQALIERFPLTLDMGELNGNELFYFFSEDLPTGSEKVGTVETGDLMLYGSDCLVLFYENFSTSYSYTRLGYIEDVTGLADALGNGSVEVTFDIN